MNAWDNLTEAARELVCERSELDIAEDYITLSAKHSEVAAQLAAAQATVARCTALAATMRDWLTQTYRPGLIANLIDDAIDGRYEPVPRTEALTRAADARHGAPNTATETAR